MRKFLVFVFPVFCAQLTFAQIFYKDVAPVFYSRCTSCHNTDAHHMPFMNYAQTAPMAPMIQGALITNKMPPWSADTSYTRFQHERIITSSEKQKILDWISGGALKGDTSLAPLPPAYNQQYQLSGEADLTLSIGNFTSSSSFSDKYYCFSVPSGLTEDRIIRAFEVVPGNKAMVHHAVITADTTGTYTSDLSGACYNIPGNLGIGNYAPGTRATVFPSQEPLKTGIYLKAGSKIIIQLHYPAGTAGQVDSTRIRLFFYPKNTVNVRRIYSHTPLQNWQMVIPANSVVPYTASSDVNTSISAYAVMPHSHLLCTSILMYAVNPGIDTIPLIRINKWDFKWQDYYFFRKLVKIPAGYKLFARHVYDNTTNNPNNPSSPPKQVFAGPDTDDEMLFDGMLFMIYQSGDESIDLESIIRNDPILNLKNDGRKNNEVHCSAFPNPSAHGLNLNYTLTEPSPVHIEIYDLYGKRVLSENIGPQLPGTHLWQNSLSSAGGKHYAPGLYMIRISAQNATAQLKFIHNP